MKTTCNKQKQEDILLPLQSLYIHKEPISAKGASRLPSCPVPRAPLGDSPIRLGVTTAQRQAQSRSSCPGFELLRNSSSLFPSSVWAKMESTEMLGVFSHSIMLPRKFRSQRRQYPDRSDVTSTRDTSLFNALS